MAHHSSNMVNYQTKIFVVQDPMGCLQKSSFVDDAKNDGSLFANIPTICL